ncbi:MAG: SPFH domain-containing protein [Candidatus Izemoplasmataceae bacterium]|jgi:regulator of protease activity HflC (stomatin/prohibitin superfamily)|uniref:SPFH domain-containing protein n=1 Tax=Liberiplasma polymorphum TaxID=3374570 RepID=UPI0037760212
MPFGWIFLIILVIIVLIYLGTRFTVVTQANRFIVERLGRYIETWDVGIHFLWPFVDRVKMKVSIKEQVVDFAPQPVITKDNVTMQIDTVVFFQITDPKLFTYGVDYPIKAIENLTATTLRNIIGDLELDESLTSRDLINEKMRMILDEATDPWGIKINRVELKNIIPPKDIREAMEKQMRAEREKRQSILIAEGNKRSAILNAEGEREARILSADGEKQTRILEAEGKAEAILTVQSATAKGIEMIRKAGADEAFLRLEAYKAFEKIADGQATKLIIPSDMQGMIGMASSIAEALNIEPKKK